MANHVSPWIPILVISSALMYDMTSCFDRVVTIQIAEIFLKKESQSIFTNKSMISNSSCHSCTKRV